VQDLLLHQAMSLLETHPPCIVRSTDSLFVATVYLLEHHIHRVWVVPHTTTGPEEVFLQGLCVLSLTDILRAVYIAEK
jgi:signal-transduction protein with cAMP-binding, CBS, and nucleotidyltransferase domain